jgi:hypothetical protein
LGSAILCAWLCTWLGSEQRARAQAVALDMSSCEQPSPTEVRGLLGVELHERLLGQDDLLPADAQTIEVHCTPDTAELRVRGTALRRSVALASVPAALRARVVALSIAELARPQPLAAAPEAPAPPARAIGEPEQPVPEPEPQPSEETVSRPRAYALWAAAEAQATPLVGFGGSLLLRVKMRDFLAWSSAVSLGRARTEIDRGKLRVWSFSVRTGLALLLESSRASLQVGAGLRGGWLQLTGEPDDAENTAAAHFDAWFIGPALFAEATWSVASHVFIALGLELDHTLREVRANVEGGTARTLSPWRSSGALGAGVAW